MVQTPTLRQARAELRRLYRRNGYARYIGHPGFREPEVARLIANTRAELSLIRRMLRRAGFKPSKPEVKGSQVRQPIYGREQVTRFLVTVGCFEQR